MGGESASNLLKSSVLTHAGSSALLPGRGAGSFPTNCPTVLPSQNLHRPLLLQAPAQWGLLRAHCRTAHKARLRHPTRDGPLHPRSGPRWAKSCMSKSQDALSLSSQSRVSLKKKKGGVPATYVPRGNGRVRPQGSRQGALHAGSDPDGPPGCPSCGPPTRASALF